MPLTVQVVTPEREVTVADDATMVIAKGVEGDLGILPGRAPALIQLALGTMVIERGDRREELLLDGGFLEIKNDNVIVLAEYAILPAELAAEDLDADIERLRAELQAAAENEAVRRQLARAEAARTMLRAY